jgi:uncharacterized damage-inducible protein DinB
MDSTAVLLEGFSRVRSGVHQVLDGLAPSDLIVRHGPQANPIAWLVWHLTRVQDDHISDAFGLDQVWTSDDWAQRFGLPFDDEQTGYGQDSEQVALVQVTSTDLLTGYYDAVHQQTVSCLRNLTEDDLDRVVDADWNPPVTLGVRLLSVVSDDLQHVGQAAYVRGLL